MNAALALIRRVCGSVAVLFFLVFSASSSAVIPVTTEYNWTIQATVSPWSTSKTSNCTWFSGAHDPYYFHPLGTKVNTETSCGWEVFYLVDGTAGSAIGFRSGSLGTRAACPANSTGTTSCTCNTGYQENSTQTACEPIPVNQCANIAGTVGTFNFTQGWSRSANYDGIPPIKVDGTQNTNNDLPPLPNHSCVNGCYRDFVKVVDAWISSEPSANGLYRMSADMEVTATATQCTNNPEDKLISATATPPACDGFVGQVNGKATCIGKTTYNVMSAFKDAKIGNPTAGSNGGLPGIPATGGDGSNAGGPKTGIDGSLKKADGQLVKLEDPAASGYVAPSPTGEEQAACGAPGQPVCAVKVDATGMPDGKNAVTTDILNAKSDALEAALTSAMSSTGKDTSWGLVPRWLQSGSCQPSVILTLPPNLGSRQITIDLCPHLPLIYALMNLLWSVWTFAAVIGMVFRVTTTSQG